MIRLINKSKQTIYAFAGNIAYTFAMWFIAVLINHYDGAKALGEYSFIQAVVSPLALFFHLQLKVMATIEFDLKEKYSQYLNVYFVSQSFFLIVAFFLGFLLNQPLLFYAFVVFKIFESFNWLIQGYHQSYNNFYNVFIISISKGSILLLTIGIVLYIGFPVFYSFLLVSIIWGLLFIVFDLPKINIKKYQFKPFKNYSLLKPLIISGASLSIISSLDVLLVAIPRYFIKGYLGEMELGKFTMVLQFFIASTIFVISVGHPFLVRLKIFIEKGEMVLFKKEVKKTILIFFSVSSLVIVGFLIFAKLIMRIFWGEENENLSIYLVISGIGIIPLFLSSIFVYAINSLKYFSVHLKYYPVILFFSIIFSWVYIPKYGILGGVITIVLTQFVRLLFTFFVYKYCLDKYDKMVLGKK